MVIIIIHWIFIQRIYAFFKYFLWVYKNLIVYFFKKIFRKYDWFLFVHHCKFSMINKKQTGICLKSLECRLFLGILSMSLDDNNCRYSRDFFYSNIAKRRNISIPNLDNIKILCYKIYDFCTSGNEIMKLNVNYFKV